MKKTIIFFILLSSLSCGVKKELASVNQENIELQKKLIDLEQKQKELEEQAQKLYDENQEYRRKIASLLREQERLKNSALAGKTNVSNPEPIFTFVEEQAVFPGGQEELMRFLRENIKYPIIAKENNIQGKVYVNFVIEVDGSISNIYVVRGIGGGCDKEAIRVIEMMPRWKPAQQRGKRVRSKFVLPIKFSLK